MNNLFSYSKPVDNVFQLYGSNEDSVTRAIAWMLYRSDAFLKAFLKFLGITFAHGSEVDIHSQRLGQRDSRLDIEITNHIDFDVIIEAKIGDAPPSESQLNKYARLLKASPSSQKMLISLTNTKVSEKPIIKEIDGIIFKNMSYGDLLPLADSARKTQCSNYEKRWLSHFTNYIEEVFRLDYLDSNRVYVVALDKRGQVDFGNHFYRCPKGKHYLTSPVNYLGFRFNGKLQSINHVDSYEIEVNEVGSFFVFHLGQNIVPSRDIKAGGKIQNLRFYCAIDLLLTCNTLIEAKEKDKKRLQEQQ